MKIDKDDDRYEPTTTQSSFRPEQKRKTIDEFTYFDRTDNKIRFDVSGYVDSLVKNIDEEIERRLAEAGYIKVVRCKDCKYYAEELCWNLYGRCTPSDMDFCSNGERRDSDETD